MEPGALRSALERLLIAANGAIKNGTCPPSIEYRQGMHELAAVALFAAQEETATTASPADLFGLVCALLDAAAELYSARLGARCDAVWAALRAADPRLADHLDACGVSAPLVLFVSIKILLAPLLAWYIVARFRPAWLLRFGEWVELPGFLDRLVVSDDFWRSVLTVVFMASLNGVCTQLTKALLAPMPFARALLAPKQEQLELFAA